MNEQVRFCDFAKSRILRVFMLILPRSKCHSRPTAVPRRPTTLGEMKVLVTFHLVYADVQIGQKENKHSLYCCIHFGGRTGLAICMWPLTCWTFEFKKFKAILLVVVNPQTFSAV